jgi:hypothetical protein
MFLFSYFISMATNFQKQGLPFLEAHILKILKSMMTPATTIAMSKNTPEHLVL